MSLNVVKLADKDDTHMSSAPLRLVESPMDKNKALDAALSADRASLRQRLDHAARAARKLRSTAESSRPAPSASISRSASAACRAAASSKSTARKARARPRWRCTSSPRRRSTGGTCAFIDAEHALDPGYAKKLGVNIDDLLISQPDAGEQALEIADTLVRSGAIDVLVVDSRRGPGAAGRARRRDGRQPCRPAGAPDEPGAAQADRLDLAVAHAW